MEKTNENEIIETKKEAEEENSVAAFFRRNREACRIVVTPEILNSYFNVDELRERINRVLPR